MNSKSNKILVLLGNENDEDENLSETATLRANTAIEFLKNNSGYVVIPTGAFGKHFNNSLTPHGKILTSYLVENGINSDRILPHTRTSNTLEDAFGILRCLNDIEKVEAVHIITSAFHMMRARYIFGRVLQQYNLTYQEAKNPSDNALLSKKIAHEKRSIAKLREEWVDISNYDLKYFPSQCCENLGYEIRHYDNVSYFAIAGAFVIFSFFFTGKMPGSNLMAFGVSAGGIFVVVLLWYLYLRFANTAASARRVLNTVERIYGVPGISSTQHTTKISGINLRVKSAISIIYSLMVAVILLQLIDKLIA